MRLEERVSSIISRLGKTVSYKKSAIWSTNVHANVISQKAVNYLYFFWKFLYKSLLTLITSKLYTYTSIYYKATIVSIAGVVSWCSMDYFWFMLDNCVVRVKKFRWYLCSYATYNIVYTFNAFLAFLQLMVFVFTRRNILHSSWKPI